MLSKGLSGSKKFHNSALLTHLPLIPFTTEATTVCTNEATKHANKAQRNAIFCFFI